ncbi:MAG TPA: hypothetical protein PKZ00_02190 [Elusimicrobiota bacterium]|nr:hypothetical protein [Elusimicrobiota bacterium]HNI56373.1 hypothetical protein [Elusimicrobiota bacterium]
MGNLNGNNSDVFVAIQIPGGAAVVEQNIIGKGRVLITVDNAIEKRPGGRPALEYAKGLATMLSVHYGVLRHMPKTFTPGHQ